MTPLGRELRLFAREPGFRLALLLAVLLSGAGLWYGQRWVEGQQHRATVALAAERQRYADLEARLLGEQRPLSAPGSAASFALAEGARSATLPPRALGTLAVGSSDLLPWVALVSLRHRGLLLEAQEFAAEEIANPYHLRTGHFDYAFVLVVLLPLLVIAWMYAFLAGERESGRSALIRLQVASPLRLWLRRLVVRWGVLSAAAIGTLAIGQVLLRGWPGLAPLLVLALLVLAYLAFWFALGFLINALGGSSAWNAVALAAGWLALVLILPQLALQAVDRISPAPSKTTLSRDLRDIANRLNAEGDAAVAAFYRERPDLLVSGAVPDMTVFLNRFFAVHQLTDRAYARRMAAYERATAARDRALGWAALASPATAVQAAVADLAGTDPDRHRRFRAQLLEYRQLMAERREPLVFADAPVPASALLALPAFRFVDTDPLYRPHSWLAALVLLFALSSGLLALAVRRLGRDGGGAVLQE